MFNSTRWLSRLDAIERICKLKNAIQFIANDGGQDRRPTLSVAKDDIWWNKLSNVIVPFLRVFQDVINVVQSDNASLLDLKITINKIIQTIATCKFESLIGCSNDTEKLFIKETKKIIEFYTNFYISSIDHHAYVSTSIITDSNIPPSADSNQQAKNSYKNSTKLAEEWMSKWGADFIIFYKKYFPHINCNDKNEITTQIIIQTTMFQGDTGDFIDKQKNKNIYKIKKSQNNLNQTNNTNVENNENEQKLIKENEIIDWKLFWTKYYHVTPHLSIIVFVYFQLE